MKVKETIALLGAADPSGQQFICALAAGHHPLVLVDKETDHLLPLATRIAQSHPKAEVATVSCEREGCWEADVIVLMNAAVLRAELLERIKAVAIRKILVYITGMGDHTWPSAERVRTVKRLLPYTEWVQVARDPATGIWSISGATGSSEVVRNILARAGYATMLQEEAY